MSDKESDPELSGDATDTEYEVEKILDHKKKHERGASRLYLIRWKGYGKDHDTWEPEENLDCKDLLEKFHKQVVN